MRTIHPMRGLNQMHYLAAIIIAILIVNYLKSNTQK